MGKNGDGVGGLSQRDFLVGTGAGVCAGLGYSVDFDGNCELVPEAAEANQKLKVKVQNCGVAARD